MFVYSFKANKKIIVGILCVIAALIVIAVALPGRAGQVNASLGVSVRLAGNDERVAFLKNFGYDVISEPVETKEIVIPEEFDNTYENYNNLQKQQGFDLSKYKGKSAKTYSYAVKNYPGVEKSSETIRANMIIINDRIVAGDVCSVKADGFMHTFNYGKNG